MASHCPSLKLAEGSLHNLRRYSKALSCKTHTPKVNSTVNSLTPLWAGNPLLHSNLNVMKTAQSVKHIRIRRIVSRIGWARLNLYRFVCHYDKACFHLSGHIIPKNKPKIKMKNVKLQCKSQKSTSLESFFQKKMSLTGPISNGVNKTAKILFANSPNPAILTSMMANHPICSSHTAVLGLTLLLLRR